MTAILDFSAAKLSLHPSEGSTHAASTCMIRLRVANVKQVRSDTFVMCGVMVDADRVAESADVLNSMFAGIYEKHEVSVPEFRANKFFRGDRGWQKITLSDKFEIIRQICCVVKSENIKIIWNGNFASRSQ